MKIMASDYVGSISDIITQLYNNPDVMEVIRGHNLRGGDFVEAIASALCETDEDQDTDDYLDIC